MNKELVEFKKLRIGALSKQYNIDIVSLNRLRASNVYTINRNRRLSSRQKQASIQQLNIQYNNVIISLQNNLKTNIDAVNKISILPIKINRKKALLFGLNYIGTGSQLNGCINDAKLIETRIKTKGFEDIDIKLITDETSIKPTREKMLSEIIKILYESIEGDLIFIYYSGHGSYIRDSNGDELDGRDELIIPLDFNPIKDDELKSIIQENLKANVTLFCLFDCCNSGTVLDLKYQCLENLNYDNFTENPYTLDTKGNVILLSGCRDEQYSYETVLGNNVQGAMTWAFNELAKNNDSITWRVLLKNMRNSIKASHFNQIPQLSSGLPVDLDGKIWI